MIRKISHVSLVVRDQDEAADWYCQKLGWGDEALVGVATRPGCRTVGLCFRSDKDAVARQEKPGSSS